MEFLRRRQSASSSQANQPSDDDKRLADAYPAVHGYLTRSEFDDGTKRMTSSLTLFSDDGTLKAVLNDREAGESLWVTAAGLAGLLGALESHLQHGTGEWRRHVTAQRGGNRRNGRESR